MNKIVSEFFVEGAVSVLVEQFSSIHHFNRLSPITLKQLASIGTVINHKARTILFTQNEPITGLYALKSGRVKLYRQANERMQILALPMRGECFGAESLPTHALSPYSASTLTAVTCLYIPPDALQTVILACSDLQELFLEMTSERLKQFVDLVHDLAFRDVTSRLAVMLLTRAQHEGVAVSDSIRIERLLSQQEVASMIGTAREVVNRLFKRFEQENLIRIDNDYIYILNQTALNTLSSQETTHDSP